MCWFLLQPYQCLKGSNIGKYFVSLSICSIFWFSLYFKKSFNFSFSHQSWSLDSWFLIAPTGCTDSNTCKQLSPKQSWNIKTSQLFMTHGTQKRDNVFFVNFVVFFCALSLLFGALLLVNIYYCRSYNHCLIWISVSHLCQLSDNLAVMLQMSYLTL